MQDDVQETPTGAADEALGPLAALLDDPTITEIMINGPQQIFVERAGKMERVPQAFADESALLRMVHAVTGDPGFPNESVPIGSWRLPDESRLVIVGHPIALTGVSVVIRKAPTRQLSLEDLLGFGCLSPEMARFLEGCVRGRVSVLISGGTASGKTTVLNIVCNMIPAAERVITIENTTGLRIQREHLVRLETRPPNLEGRGEITSRQLVEVATQMRPERLVVGELLGAETWAFAQALNTGHDGSLASIHATSVRDALVRLETQMALAEPSLTIPAIREQIASAVDVIVQVSRLPDGTRKLVTVSELTGVDAEVIALQDLFVYEQTGIDGAGRSVGHFRPTGARPRFLAQLRQQGVDLPESLFETAGATLVQPAELGPSDVASLDSQLGEVTAMMALLFRAGYNVGGALDLLANELPNPASSAMRAGLEEMRAGGLPLEALTARVPSVYLRALADTLAHQYREGGNLADMLDPLAEQIRAAAGADPATDAVGDRIRSFVGAPPRAPHPG